MGNCKCHIPIIIIISNKIKEFIFHLHTYFFICFTYLPTYLLGTQIDEYVEGNKQGFISL
jgi:hypothetical protein